MKLGEFASLLGARSIGIDLEAEFSSVFFDSRYVQAGSVFVAVRGSRADGAQFAPEAIERGAIAVLAERPLSAPCLVVDDLVEALASVGRALRARFEGPVVGITGSNGKTTTKEFCAAALAPLGPVLKSSGNQNTEYSSPLVWIGMESDHKTAVLEMAMRGRNQIAHLSTIHSPTVAVVTMIGTAHIELLHTREEIMRAKAEIFDGLVGSRVAVLWREDDFYADLCDLAPGDILTFGFSQEADVQIEGYMATSLSSCELMMSWQGRKRGVSLPTVGRHQALNAAAAVAAAISCSVEFESAVSSLPAAQLPPMRLEIVSHQGATLVLDTYNASPDSTCAAISTLAEMPCDGRRLAVLGEMRELGSFSEAGHRAVGDAIIQADPDAVYLAGGATSFVFDQIDRAGFPRERVELRQDLCLSDVFEFLSSVRPGDLVLVKGSRALELEKAVDWWRLGALPESEVAPC